MNRTSNERFIILILSLACVGLSIENVLMNWEFWVPPIIVLGAASLWVMHLTEDPEYKMRRMAYFVYAALLVFYHGVHETSYNDVAIVVVFGMVVFSLLNSVLMMHLLLTEYFVLVIVQFILARDNNTIVFDVVTISRTLLYLLIVPFVYVCCMKVISDRIESQKSEDEKDERIEEVDRDMEDFLSNISHELRTPVNVVLGMSEMQIKKGLGDEAFSIRMAGDRLAYQIENIQDYTECKRNNIILEEDDYLCTSLINDIVTSFKLFPNEKKLDLILDMNPNVPTKLRGDVKKLHKIFRHLIVNAIKFTKKGGIYVKLFCENKDYGVNLIVEITDTGIGMDRKAIAAVSEGMYQVNKKRNRSSGGIGLGLFIVYGFAHKMGGFVKIESEKRVGTTVRVTIPQTVADATPCLSMSKDFSGDVIFHARSGRYKNPRVRDFYRAMATNLASSLHISLYPAETEKEIETLREKYDITAVVMGQEEYEADPAYFDKMSSEGITVAVSALEGFKVSSGSGVLVLPKPLYSYPVVKAVNEGKTAEDLEAEGNGARSAFKGIKVLIVDDEPMNLVVATGLFSGYQMITDTAGSGKEAISKFKNNDYDVVFMDHMMPEMDGVEAMKHIKAAADEMDKSVIVIALTANAVSGAKEMFMKEGFDGFIAKPIFLPDFERVMLRELAKKGSGKGGHTS